MLLARVTSWEKFVSGWCAVVMLCTVGLRGLCSVQHCLLPTLCSAVQLCARVGFGCCPQQHHAVPRAHSPTCSFWLCRSNDCKGEMTSGGPRVAHVVTDSRSKNFSSPFSFPKHGIIQYSLSVQRLICRQKEPMLVLLWKRACAYCKQLELQPCVPGNLSA